MNSPNLCTASPIVMSRTSYVTKDTPLLRMSRCHAYEGPEWVPEWNSVEGWHLRNNIHRAVKRRSKDAVYHWIDSPQCRYALKPHNEECAARVLPGDQFGRLQFGEQCQHCAVHFKNA